MVFGLGSTLREAMRLIVENSPKLSQQIRYNTSIRILAKCDELLAEITVIVEPPKQHTLRLMVVPFTLQYRHQRNIDSRPLWVSY